MDKFTAELEYVLAELKAYGHDEDRINVHREKLRRYRYE